MALCPSGHESQTTDYCDLCGAVMGGAPPNPSASSAALSSTAVLPNEAEPAAGGAVAPCPQCGAARDGRFCEECGFDYEMAALVPPTPMPSPPPAPTPAGSSSNPDGLAETLAMGPDYDFDAEYEAAERAYAESGPAGRNEGAAEASQGASPESAGPSSGTGAETAASLTAVAVADREYYDAQVERGDIVASEYPFPRYSGERRFVLDGDVVRIGRASASRGLVVEIDLTGPPLDPAVSHLHAQLLRRADGSWALVDLDSANGTRLNGAEQPVAAETEIPVRSGDRIHLGVWTTLTLQES